MLIDKLILHESMLQYLWTQVTHRPIDGFRLGDVLVDPLISGSD